MRSSDPAMMTNRAGLGNPAGGSKSPVRHYEELETGPRHSGARLGVLSRDHDTEARRRRVT